MAKEENVITSAIDFLNKIREGSEVTIKFKKKNTGEMRVMKCTLDFKKIPKADRPKKVNLAQILKLINKNKIIHVYDTEQRGWRSVPFENCDWIESNNIKYRVKL